MAVSESLANSVKYMILDNGELVTSKDGKSIALVGEYLKRSAVVAAHKESIIKPDGTLTFPPIIGRQKVKNPRLTPKERALLIANWRANEIKEIVDGKSQKLVSDIEAMSDDDVADVLECDKREVFKEVECVDPRTNIWTVELLRLLTPEALDTARVDRRFNCVSLNSTGDIMELLRYMTFVMQMSDIVMQKEEKVTQYRALLESGFVPAFIPPSYLMNWHPLFLDAIKRTGVRYIEMDPMRFDGAQPQIAGQDIWVSRLDVAPYLGIDDIHGFNPIQYLNAAVGSYLNNVPAEERVGIPPIVED